ncbi:uncharacterized protein LOC126318446 [Schistocerca gregaria]|uniref:uncharacterized protein LOC126318446 n=1 Tax=Schistocerca gregaria TaxID=7010 RepID=UPI00211E2E0C|nr:uncharacterized protein LOC126318446 [Schistocerca gregaria]
MALHLYHLTLQRPSAITHAISGNFTDLRDQELLVVRGHAIELLRPDMNGKLNSIVYAEVFGCIRSIATFRLPGTSKDYILVGSDSGKIVILEYSAEKNAFVKLHEETFGRSGVRRVVPGQYLAVDPSGRATLIGAVEKQKFVYILNRDNEARLTISSPLEAHKSNTFLFDVVGIDVNYMNPLFAAIELDYYKSDQDPTGEAVRAAQRVLTWYELDLGLNHVVRKSSQDIDKTSHRLIGVPGDDQNPGGVMVCAKNRVYYYSQASSSAHGESEVFAVIPKRRDRVCMGADGSADTGTLIVAHTLLKTATNFFFLLMTENGDLFKLTVDRGANGAVLKIHVAYYDTVPVATSIVTLSPGFLFVASETGNQYLYFFKDLAEGGAEPEEGGELFGHESSRATGGDVYFDPRPLRHLQISDEIPCLHPILDLKVENIDKEETPQIFALSGSGPRSALRVLRHGIPVIEAASVRLPSPASSVWVLKTSAQEAYDQYIIVSFASNTLILGIGDTVEEIKEGDPLYGAFSTNVTTLNIGRLNDDTFVQITPSGYKHIRHHSYKTWEVPNGHRIVHSCINRRQVVVAVSGGDVHYFELDSTGNLNRVGSVSLEREVVTMAIQHVPQDRQRGRFLAIADAESKVRIYSLESSGALQSLAIQVLPSKATSLALFTLSTNQLILAIGTQNGLFMRSQVDLSSGQLSDSRKKYLGTRAVRLLIVKVPGGAAAMLALSSRSWLLYQQQATLCMLPLACASFDYAASLHSLQCQDSIVCTTRERLGILSIDRLGDMFNQTEIPLRYTPRQSAIYPISKLLLTVESDHNAYSGVELSSLSALSKNQENTDAHAEANGAACADAPLPSALYGGPKPGPGRWGSCVRLLDVKESMTLDLFELDNNEAAISIATCSFRDHSGEIFICVGTAKDLVLQPKRSCSAAYIHVYELTSQGRKLQFLHKKQVEDIPGALTQFNSRLLAGIGSSLKLFDLGKKKPQLLRKCELSGFPTHIVNISTIGERIIVGDLQESIHFVKYSRPDSLSILADDITPRWMTCCEILDYNTVAGSDKFGNVFIMRLPEKVAQLENDPTGKATPYVQGYLCGAPHKLDAICNFHIGEMVTRLKKTRLTPGGSEFLLYVTVHGTIGALMPLSSREDVDFFSHLEMHFRQENPPLCGRNHLAYRSAYFPVKNVIDGDLCEMFASLPEEKQNSLCSQMDQTAAEIQRKIEDIRDQI